MLSENDKEEIEKHLQNSQNPLFLFDNDPDGLCSFLLLRRYLERGKGFHVKGGPLDDDYMRKVNEFEPDCIFVLDVPVIDDSFFEEVRKRNLPVVWIDHHEISDQEKENIPDFVNYFNPFSKSQEPSATSDICYKVVGNKDNIWIAVAGCIADKLLPDYYESFKEHYPDLGIESQEPFEVYYNSDIGKISQMMNHGLKDRTTNVVKMMKFLTDAKGPYEVLKESKENREMHEKFKEVQKKYEKVLSKSKEEMDEEGKIIFFEYGGDTSMSSEISNRLQYKHPEKFIFVAYLSQESTANISGRGYNVKKILEEALKKGNFENANGGGHRDAVGAKILKKDLEEFKRLVKEAVSKRGK